MKLEILTKHENRDIQNGIIAKIRDLINYKNLEPGDKLPAERVLSEKFGVSRSNVREAIQKLEFYGILNSKPQSGTFIANIGQIAMNGMIDDILSLEEQDFKSLVETRILLELKTVKLAALRRTEEDLERLKQAFNAYKTKMIAGDDCLEEDLLFHLAIASASKNSTMNTLMLLITPEIIVAYDQDRVCDGDVALAEVKKHEDIYMAIKDQNPQLAKEKMKLHFSKLYDYIYGKDRKIKIGKG
ncbi:FadR/GntR family transcriptional regulator [Zobellia galactanivorans]|uniref:GntR-type transcriptional regulator n=1 Tax=Zobellia galactanivorans (strain DSM 12802 / CCUG 47099 / CIP 106680 / NCIMB 13871 / Dsij) TaxID=63186 RepID=G0LCA0_ZOBGA|nr:MULTISPECIES: FadR/GntR family transcriptional regulator [Zobellia]MBU3027611.1 FadR family transcriptional regulator [Zobellia galactanivorans]MDO6806992.1 FadR/GntR family transcriptional regulator [Zobellia galactanivorans]OWW23902.1 GntR family transcriptional regulator [Zobellia sp. OII3]CAZ96767.1 GntR-type transcriptional regulator [Zobellia galactanivorans]